MANKQRYGEDNKELMALTGLNIQAVTGYIRLYPALMLHEVAEQALANTNGSLKECQITIPKVGIIYVERKSGEGITYSFVPDECFEKQLVKTMDTGDSPLTPMLEKSVVSTINKKYNSMI